MQTFPAILSDLPLDTSFCTLILDNFRAEGKFIIYAIAQSILEKTAKHVYMIRSNSHQYKKLTSPRISFEQKLDSDFIETVRPNSVVVVEDWRFLAKITISSLLSFLSTAKALDLQLIFLIHMDTVSDWRSSLVPLLAQYTGLVFVTKPLPSGFSTHADGYLLISNGPGSPSPSPIRIDLQYKITLDGYTVHVWPCCGNK